MFEKIIDVVGAVLCFVLAVCMPMLAMALIDLGGGQ